ncbi:hypothetical protein NO995_07660 [Aestuariibaculum sp. M13]|uniref:hypothetical protein n=1 Tax=Aestuariibaculum sp. M13 TaxID=2967132 RepID=UPI002159FFED|nr:hypothetical protein [Aestuariibaculum sp. M13]MCR8667552.1 hypothetical protein [Aestuariibaculum sp. M13]
MKKTIVIAFVFIFALAISFTTNANGGNLTENLDLTDLLTLNTANAECEYKKNGTCEFKCDDTPNETCKGEATVAGYKTRVTCDGKEVSC